MYSSIMSALQRSSSTTEEIFAFRNGRTRKTCERYYTRVCIFSFNKDKNEAPSRRSKYILYNVPRLVLAILHCLVGWISRRGNGCLYVLISVPTSRWPTRQAPASISSSRFRQQTDKRTNEQKDTSIA